MEESDKNATKSACEQADFSSVLQHDLLDRSTSLCQRAVSQKAESSGSVKEQSPNSFIEFGQITETTTEAPSRRSPSERESNALRRLTTTAEDHGLSKEKGSLDLPSIRTSIEKVFNQIDANGDGKISLTQLNKAIQDPKFVGESAQGLAALYLLRNELSVNGDITKESLEKGLKLETAFALTSGIGTVERIGRLLLNNDESYLQDITKQTLEERLQSTKLSASEKVLLKTALDRFDDLLTLLGSAGDSLSRYDLKKLSSLGEKFQDISNAREIKLAVSRTKDSQDFSNSGLYGSSDRVSAEAVQQGTVGDCPILASLISAANAQPELVKQMIKQLENGKYEVTFPGDPKNPVLVSSPTQAELGLFNKATAEGIWPAVLEKAYGEYVRRRQSDKTDPLAKTPPCDESSPAAECLAAGEQFDALKLLSNSPAKVFDLRHSLTREFAKTLSDAIEQKSLIIAASKAFYFPDAEVQSRHMYAVVGFDPSGPDGGTIILADPHGKDSPSGGKPLRIPLFEFHKKFGNIAIAKTA